ncbi:ABC transporter efflux protein, DrrB family [Jatrophihabitans endophyticus]|uniref:Transport permease protein n=1 Tax=Jatrophihabitans endophyticus TaxID=1206085 RepID=A0A1M5DZP2_9ACTN|nr:ABC transporter permease [Jatrophihabitans endophyticus]SHF72478.1 ABC transporter efflux protein, DrrB family [Jatrophihabitans endophyticus]
MNAATTPVHPPTPAPIVAPLTHGPLRRISDVLVLAGRNLVHISREPFQLSDVTIQPVLFTLMFVYVFGAGVVLPGNAAYKDYAVPGLLVFNLVTITVGTGVGLSTDVNSGVIDRFRTLPMWRPGILVARSVTDLLTAVVCAAIVSATGFAIGWSPHDGAVRAIAAFALVLLFGYAVSWLCACLGLVSKGVETAQALGLLVLFPIVFVSNALVPTQRMTPWLRDVTTWNPISAVSAAARELLGNPDPAAAIDAWPMHHPVLTTLLWTAGLLLVFDPLATVLYRRRAAD